MALNIIGIQGRLVREPETRRTGSGVQVGNFTLAVDRDFKGQDGTKETDFIDCVAWRGTAETLSKYFKKGSMATVVGRLQSRKWTDKNGAARTAWEVQVDHLYFGEPKRSDSGSSVGSYAPPTDGGYGSDMSYGGMEQNHPTDFSYPYPGSAPASDFALLEDDDAMLPF